METVYTHERAGTELKESTTPDPNDSNTLIVVAIFLSILIAAIDALVTIKSFYLRSVGTITETVRQLYIQGTTVLATILTKFVASQAQTLLLRSFDHQLRATHDPDLRHLSRKWRTILQASPLKEAWSRWSRLGIFASYFFVGLMTTAMVASLSPSVSSRQVHYPQAVFNGLSKHIEGNPGICTRVIPLDEARRRVDQDYYWDLGNGSAYYIPANEGGCPTRYAQFLVGNINNLDPDAFAYADGGVAVHRSAIGAPITTYSPNPGQAPSLHSTLSSYGSHALTTTQCVPVLKRNPISCHPGGTIKLTNRTFSITSDDGLCIYEASWADRNPRESSTMVKHMCTRGDVGQGTIVLAASGQYAHFLALCVNDTAGAPPTGPPAYETTYAISCSVDARDVYVHRVVGLDMRAADDGEGTRYSRFLNGTGEGCAGPEMDRARIATLAAANWQTLFQNDGSDGWFDLVWEALGGHGGSMPTFGFNDSVNALEDVLGLVAAMVGARFNGTEEYNITATVEVEVTRVGSANLLVLLWMIPPLFAAGLIISLLLRTAQIGSLRFRSIELEDLKTFFAVRRRPVDEIRTAGD